MKKIGKKNESKITTYFKENEKEINAMLTPINSTFHQALTAIGDVHNTFYVTVNRSGKILYRFYANSECRTVLNFIENIDKVNESITKDDIYLKHKELRVQFMHALYKVICHYIDMCLNPVCVYLENDGDGWEEDTRFYCYATYYRERYQYFIQNRKSQFEIEVLNEYLNKNDILYYADNDDSNEDMNFEGMIGKIREDQELILYEIPVGLPGYIDNVEVGYSYFHRYDDPMDI